jgi:hypothetical protein
MIREFKLFYLLREQSTKKFCRSKIQKVEAGSGYEIKIGKRLLNHNSCGRCMVANVDSYHIYSRQKGTGGKR